MPLLKDLNDHQCRYPVTEEPPFVMCGRAKQAGSSYCPRHHKVCVSKKVRALDYIVGWIDKYDPTSAPSRHRDERVKGVDEVLT